MAKKRRPSRARVQPGASPGTLNAPPGALPPRIVVMDYDREQLTEKEIADPRELEPWLRRQSVTWIDVVGLGDVALFQRIGEVAGVHPLVLEDVLNVIQRPKLERHGDGLFFVTRLARLDGDALDTQQISLYLTRHFLLTFQERPGDAFEPIRQRLRAGRPRIRAGGCDYLAYALIDALVDANFPLVEDLREHLEDLEEEIFGRPSESSLEQVHQIKRDLRLLRRVVRPTSQAVADLMSPDQALVGEPTRVFLRDVYDHAIKLGDTIDGLRELGKDLTDLYLSAMSHRTNEIMRVLTVFAAIFIPLSFIAGLFGMNFDPSISPWNMPELGWRWGYPAALGLMLAVAVGLLIYFRRRGWIGGDGADDQEPA